MTSEAWDRYTGIDKHVIRKKSCPKVSSKDKRSMRWFNFQSDDNSLNQITRAVQDRYTDRDTHVIKKELAEGQLYEWQQHDMTRASMIWQEKNPRGTQTETPMWFKKELAEGQLYKWLNKHEMTRASMIWQEKSPKGTQTETLMWLKKRGWSRASSTRE